MAGFHTRSISLPSRAHPAVANVEEQVCRLKASQDKSSPVFQQLSGLKELNKSLEGLLELPGTQQSLSKDIYVEQVLDGSLRMLDLCGTAIDVFSQTKESLQVLESSLRRKRGSESCLKNEISQYMESRKKLSKVINNFLKTLNKNCRSDKNESTAAAVRTLEDVEEINISVFESLLSFISLSKSKSNWSMVSKLMKSRRSLCNKEDDTNEIVKIEAELFKLKSNKDIKSIDQVQQVLKGLKAIESNVEEIAEELECVFRQLVKNRASLLNILNH